MASVSGISCLSSIEFLDCTLLCGLDSCDPLLLCTPLVLAASNILLAGGGSRFRGFGSFIGLHGEGMAMSKRYTGYAYTSVLLRKVAATGQGIGLAAWGHCSLETGQN